jgi:anti-anti-sigma factor
MSAFTWSTTLRKAPRTDTEPAASVPTHRLRLMRHRSAPLTVVVSVHGDIDAANTDELIAYVYYAIGTDRGLILDLRHVDFIGTAGISALEAMSPAGDRPWRMVVVPSRVVTRLLELCPPAAPIQLAEDLDAARAAVHGARPVLELTT